MNAALATTSFTPPDVAPAVACIFPSRSSLTVMRIADTASAIVTGMTLNAIASAALKGCPPGHANARRPMCTSARFASAKVSQAPPHQVYLTPLRDTVQFA